MKKITWSDIILIIEKMFDLRQTDIAKRLGVNKATISRLKRGKIRRPTFSEKETCKKLYEKVFEPTNEKSPAKKSEGELLVELKYILQETGFQGIMEDLWMEEITKANYKKFVMTMLERTVSNPALEKKSVDKKSPFDFLLHLFPKAAAQQARDRSWIKIKK